MKTYFEAVSSRMTDDQTKKAVQVKIDNAFVYLKNNHMGFREVIETNPTILPLYDTLWLEYATAFSTVGFLCARLFPRKHPQSSTQDVSATLILTMFTYDKLACQLIAPVKYRILVAKDSTIARDEKGLMIFGSAGRSPDLDPLSVPLFALSLMQYRNVTLEKVGGTDYHSLVIRHMNEPEHGKRTQQTTIRHGHLKDYRQGGGLFGKLHGLYWWEAAVVGKKSKSAVLKDYDVDSPDDSKIEILAQQAHIVNED